MKQLTQFLFIGAASLATSCQFTAEKPPTATETSLDQIDSPKQTQTVPDSVHYNLAFNHSKDRKEISINEYQHIKADTRLGKVIRFAYYTSQQNKGFYNEHDHFGVTAAPQADYWLAFTKNYITGQQAETDTIKKARNQPAIHAQFNALKQEIKSIGLTRDTTLSHIDQTHPELFKSLIKNITELKTVTQDALDASDVTMPKTPPAQRHPFSL